MALNRLLRKQQRGRVHISASDVEAAQKRKSAAQAAFSAAKRDMLCTRDVLGAFDESKFPEARYYAAHNNPAPLQGLDLLHESGLLVDRSLDDDYKVLCFTIRTIWWACPHHYCSHHTRQRLSEVTCGAHPVLCVRLRHAGCDDTKALKVVPLSQIRQIQREVWLGVWLLFGA